MNSTSHPTVNDVRPFIGSKNFDLSRDFYIALGWELTYDSETIRVMQLDDFRFYLQNYFQKDWCENTMLHVSVDDVDAWHHFVTSAFDKHNLHECGRITGMPVDEGYGRVFKVWDPGGSLIHFAQFK